MSKLSDAIEQFKGSGLSRRMVKMLFGRGKSFKHIGARTLPKGHRAKRKRLQKIQKESRRKNRNRRRLCKRVRRNR